jgi:flagellar hook assembly protein FlgD
LVDGELSSGENKIVWNGLNDENNSVSSGIYLYKINTGNKTLYGKMILQK